MAELIKVHVKDFNQHLLREQFDTAGLPGGALLWAGFERSSRRVYTPSAAHGNTPGELRFNFDPDLTAPQEATMDSILTLHIATNLSGPQQNEDQDEIDRVNFVATYNDWDTLNNSQKTNRTKELFRVVARLVDSRTDL